MPDAPAEAKPGIRLRIDQSVELGSSEEIAPVSPLEQAYLLLLQQGEGRGVTREEVFRLLWATESNEAARHRLRQLNYNLKRKAGGPVVDTRGGLVRLAEDVAVEWGRAPAWSTFPTPTAEYADRIEEMQTARERSAAREVVHELETARLSDAPEALLRFLARGDTAPTAWRDALWALLRTGRIREAEFELRRAFGDRVPPEGLSLGRRLASYASKLLNTASAGGEISIPLIGRGAETQRLAMLLAQETPSILLTGQHGVGRSRLLGHAMATILTEDVDLVVLGARGSGNEVDRPFGGLTQLLSEETLPQAHDELAQPHHEVLSRALPVRFESRGPHHLAQIGGPGSYLRVARALEALFERAFGTAEIILCIDDLHTIDRSTLEVITFLLRDQAVRLLGSWCTEEPGTDTELVLRVQDLRAELVPLGDLELESACRFAQTVGGELSPEEAAEIARVAGCRPGRIVDLIRALGGAGLPRRSGPSLDSLLRARVRELEALEQEVLLLLAVNRGRLSVEALAQLLGTGILQAAGHARTLEESGLVRLDPDETAVVPGLMRDFIMRELPSSVREATHCRIADVLEESSSDDYATIGHHRLAAGRAGEAAEWFQKAAGNAKDQTAYAEAIALLEKSIAAAEEYDPELGGDLGRLYFGMGDFQNSIHSYERARASLPAAQQIATELTLRLGQLEVELENARPKQALVQEIRDVHSTACEMNEPELVARAIDLHLKVADYAHDWVEMRSARSALLREVDSTAFHPRLGIVGARLCYLGERAVGLKLARRAYLSSRGRRDLRQLALSRLLMCLAHQSRFEGGRARVLMAEADVLAEGMGDLNTRFGLLANRVVWLMDNARWDEAQRTIQRSMQFVVGPDTVELQTLTINRCVLAVRRGDIAEAARWTEVAKRWRPSPRQSLNALHDACQLIVALEQGRVRAARRLFKTLRELDLGFPFSSDLSLVPIALATFLRRTGRRSEAADLLVEAARAMVCQSDAALQRIRASAI